jgi:hypothetical protein
MSARLGASAREPLPPVREQCGFQQLHSVLHLDDGVRSSGQYKVAEIKLRPAAHHIHPIFHKGLVVDQWCFGKENLDNVLE